MMVDLARGDSARILAVAQAADLTVQQTAYVLATACWETAQTMRPVREAFYLGSAAAAYRGRLRYAPWYGRGYVQLTWRDNYLRAGQAIGVDLIADPDRALDPEIAAQVLVQGMMRGWFTGRTLARYVDDGRADYVGARAIINGTDCASQIAALADAYEAVLSPYPAEIVRRGMQGTVVTRLQRALVAAGQAITPDGIFGAKTEQALRVVQHAAGIVADGIAGPATWAVFMTNQEVK